MYDTSLSDLRARLDEIEKERAEVAAVLAEAKEAQRDDFVEGIRSQIVGAGYSLDEIVHGLVPQPAPRQARERKSPNAISRTTYVLNTDPSKTYVRGPVPGWMKNAMIAAGLDPSMGADRTTFKAVHMTLAE